MDTLKKQKTDWDDPSKAASKIAKKVAKLEKKRDKSENDKEIEQINEQIAEINDPDFGEKTKENIDRAIGVLTTYINSLSNQETIDDIIAYIGV